MGGAGLLEGDLDPASADLSAYADGRNDGFGYATVVGDFDGDGDDDLAIGAPGVDLNGANAGAVYIFFSPTTASIEPDEADTVLFGSAPGDFAGATLVSGHDIDGDGKEDLVVGSNADHTGSNRARVAWVVSGASIEANPTMDLATSDAMLTGEADDDAFGVSLAIGDVDRDGVPDVIVGAPKHDTGGNNAGAAYVFHGPVFGPLGALDADARIDATSTNARFGSSILAGLDLDIDGHDDLLIGARQDNRGAPKGGSVNVFSSRLGFSGTFTDADADAYVVGGAYDRVGTSMAPAGDLDFDGGADIWVGASHWGAQRKGRAYLLKGTDFFDGAGTYTAEGIARGILTGENANDYAGSSLAGDIDINADGLNDIIVGGEYADGAVLQSGVVWVVYAPSFNDVQNLVDVAAVRIGGVNYRDFMGGAVAGGDLNGDGYDDVITGAWHAREAGTRKGQVSVFFGGDDPGDLTTFYLDADGDGFGELASTTQACSVPAGYAVVGTDCNDSSTAYFPGAPEGCSDPDFNCDGFTGNVDHDGDGYDACNECDDGAVDINPAATELCGDGIDNDCDGAIDDGNAADSLLWCGDADGDGFGNDATCVRACTDPGLFVGIATNVGLDCDDTDLAINPAVPELCDLVDNDCDGDVDESDALDVVPWYPDADGDGYGGYANAQLLCAQPAGHVTNADDCDDTNAAIAPGELEVCDAVDNNCDGMHHLGVPQDASAARLTVTGERTRGELGSAVAFLGDQDADGDDEFVIAASAAAIGGPSTGVVYIQRGSSHGGTYGYDQARVDGTGPYDTRITTPRARTRLGTALATGDVNGDGVEDLLVGASGAPAPSLNQGAAYLFLGPIPTGELTVSDAVFTVRGSAAGAQLGASLALADIDDDGLDDLILGSPLAQEPTSPLPRQGAVHVFYGSAALVGEASASNADAVRYGGVEGAELGLAVADAGDLDGDGFTDLALGAPKEGVLEFGSVELVFGRAARLTDEFVADATFDGERATDWVGIELAGAGDVNGDGYDDLLVGTDDTRAYLLYGSATRPSDALASAAFDLQFAGAATSRAGRHVAGLGDVDLDGYDDFAISAHRYDGDVENGGAVYVVYGAPDYDAAAGDDDVIPLDDIESFGRIEDDVTYAAASLQVLEGARIVGTRAFEGLGSAVAGGGDFNGDGIPDHGAGASGWAPSDENKTGRAMVFLGGPFGTDDDASSDPLTKTTYFWDSDGDGFTDEALGTFTVCEMHLPLSWRDPAAPVPRGTVTHEAPYDCDDDAWQVFPGAYEANADGIDSDCDGFDDRNTPPNLDLVLEPEFAYTVDNIVAVPNATDDEGETVTVTYTWFVDGVEVVGVTGDTLDKGNHTKNQVVSVEAWASDGRETAGPFLANREIRNTEPTLTACQVTPASPDITTALSGTAAGLFDPDLEDVGNLTVSYQWWQTVGPVFVEIPGATGQTLDSCEDRNTGGFYDCRRDSILYLACTPHDGEESGDTYDSSLVIIGNSTPSITSCSIDQTSATTVDDLTASATTADPDGDVVNVTYTWLFDSATSSYTGAVLPSSATQHFQSIQVRCTPIDQAGGVGTPVTSAPLVISNTPPGAPDIDLGPGAPRSDDDLVTTILADAPDIDGDTVTYLYTWTRDGAPFSNPSATLDWADTNRAEVWEVTVTAYDGTETGGSDSDFVVIRNGIPSVTSVALTPTAPRADQDISAVATGWYDPDDDTERYETEWSVNGVVVTSGNDMRLDSSFYVRGNTVEVSITAVDSFDIGNTVSSSAVTIANSPPTAPVVAVLPTTPNQTSNLLCNVLTASDDIDGDSVSYTYRWYSDGPNTNIAGQTLSFTNTSYAENWYCTATPNDGLVDGPVGTSPSVAIQDILAPPAPTIDPIDRYRNEDSLTLSGTCTPGITDCDTMTVTCADGFGTVAYAPSCDASSTWSQAIAATRGRTVSCSAICTDSAGGDSLPSNVVTTEVCDPSDVYDEESLYAAGYGDSSSNPVDEWPVMPDDNSVALTIVSNIIGDDLHDWLVIRTLDDPVADAAAGMDAYKFEIEMTVGTSDYELVVVLDNPTAPPECPIQGTYDDYTDDMAVDFDAPDRGVPSNVNLCANNTTPNVEGPWSTTNECEDLDHDYYVRVNRELDADCQPYTLRVYNGRP